MQLPGPGSCDCTLGGVMFSQVPASARALQFPSWAGGASSTAASSPVSTDPPASRAPASGPRASAPPPSALAATAPGLVAEAPHAVARRVAAAPSSHPQVESCVRMPARTAEIVPRPLQREKRGDSLRRSRSLNLMFKSWASRRAPARCPVSLFAAARCRRPRGARAASRARCPGFPQRASGCRPLRRGRRARASSPGPRRSP